MSDVPVPETQVIILHETVWQSAVRDLISAAVLLGMVGIGIWLESNALQCVGGATWVLWLFCRMAGDSSARLRLTPAEAVRHLVDTFGVRPGG